MTDSLAPRTAGKVNAARRAMTETTIRSSMRVKARGVKRDA
jgi:hypothetical protein